MKYGTVRRSLRALALGAAFSLGASQAFAGKIYISGHDSDDNGHVSVSYGAQLLTALGTGNTNAAPVNSILVLGGATGTSGTNIGLWDGASTAVLTYASGAAAIAAANLGNFAGIFMPSAINHTGGGMTQAELDAINLRGADIVSYVNSGGNLGALTQRGLIGAFGWFPLGALTTNGVGSAAATQTAALLAFGITATNAEISGDAYHNDFTGPPGFFGLSVLATLNSTGTAVILGGGVGTIIAAPEPGTLALLGVGLAGIGFMRRKHAARRA